MIVWHQYEHEGHTMTLAKPAKVGDVMDEGMFAEINGKKPKTGDPIPYEVLQMVHGLVWDIPFNGVALQIDRWKQVRKWESKDAVQEHYGNAPPPGEEIDPTEGFD